MKKLIDNSQLTIHNFFHLSTLPTMNCKVRSTRLLRFAKTLCRANRSGRTDKAAQVAAYALCANDIRLARFVIKTDSLMSAIPTRRVAPAAAYALRAVNLWQNNGLAVQFVRRYEPAEFLAHYCVKTAYSAHTHVMLQARYQVVDDAVAVLHYGRANLHVTAAQLNVFQGIAPRLNSANAAELHVFHYLVLCHFEDEALRYRLYCTTRIARDGLAVGHGTPLAHRHRLY